MKCDRQACILRLERLAAGARILAEHLRGTAWYDEAEHDASALVRDAQFVQQAINQDTSWKAGDR